MSEPQNDQVNNPLHGVKLADMLEQLVEICGWEHLGEEVDIRCFTHDPSIKSSLMFLRRTPWAREKVERFYLHVLKRGYSRRVKPKRDPGKARYYKK
ncbi:MAG: VF530 family protein [Reichenbachiella sp.]|uniref:VF530 family protein n=1 Tax=Reichenbachiella sp. TaxID=2184521 RepID=UPI0032640EDC